METATGKKIGVWLDHAKAYFIDAAKQPALVETAYSGEESQVRIKGEHGGDGAKLGNNRSTNSEYHKHNRQEDIMNKYYELLADRLKNYDDIYLFGPTLAKDELYNHLKTNKHFSDKIINVAPADQLTENQMVAQVKHFFNL
jgi:hypothetical protein